MAEVKNSFKGFTIKEVGNGLINKLKEDFKMFSWLILSLILFLLTQTNDQFLLIVKMIFEGKNYGLAAIIICGLITISIFIKGVLKFIFLIIKAFKK